MRCSGPFVYGDAWSALDRSRLVGRLDLRGRLLPIEGELALGTFSLESDADLSARRDLTEEDPLGELVLDHGLDGPAQRAGAHRRVIALLREELTGRLGDVQGHGLLGEATAEAVDEQVHDLDDLGLLQLREDDGVIHTVEELGTEVLTQLLVDLPFIRS